MNRENFADYLNNPSKLYQLSRTELRGLVIEHPFAPNLRVLHWLKAQLENDPAAEELLHQAAARTFDRRHLFLILQRDILPQLSPEEREEILELKSLTELEKELLPAQPAKEEPPAAARSLDTIPPSGDSARLPTPEDEEEDEPTLRVTVPTPPPGYRLPEHLLANLAAVTILPGIAVPAPETTDPDRPFELRPLPIEEPESTAEPPASVPTGYRVSPERVADIAAVLRSVTALQGRGEASAMIAPVPKQRFRAWRERDDRRAALRHRLRDRARQRIRREEEPTGVSEAEVRDIARQSVSRTQGLASETLARILVEQGKYQRAIAMYRALSLSYPEKSATFAAIIDELQQKH